MGKEDYAYEDYESWRCTTDVLLGKRSQQLEKSLLRPHESHKLHILIPNSEFGQKVTSLWACCKVIKYKLLTVLNHNI